MVSGEELELFKVMVHHHPTQNIIYNIFSNFCMNSYCMNNTHCELSHLMHVSWGGNDKPPLFFLHGFSKALCCSSAPHSHNPASPPRSCIWTWASTKSRASFIHRCRLCTLTCNTSCCLNELWARYSSCPLSHSIAQQQDLFHTAGPWGHLQHS